MEPVPAVVALVVARRPGPWLEEALESLAVQDYPNLSVLVVATGESGGQDLAGQVAASLPDAHFASVEGGFAEAANQGMEMVEGAAHVLLCHDDVALSEGAVRLLVEEAYRSNAALTCPKVVHWGAPERLASVGMGADRLGVVHPLVEPGELDQGQHDAVREVFVAPGGAVLVRTDLWRALGGLTGGEGLDLSWRAHLAGARVVVAPRAVARHLEACREGPEAEERDRLRALWTCYSLTTLLIVAPAVVLSALAESVWGLCRHRPPRTLPVVALASSFSAPRQLLAHRRRAQGLRRASDFALWKSQSRGSARLRAALRERPGRPARLRATGLRSQLGRQWDGAVAAALVALLVAGSRGLLTEHLPLVGQLPTAAGGIGSWWHSWWSGPTAAGLGARTFGPPGLLFMGLVGILCFGSAGVAAHVLVLAPLLLGPVGAYVGAGQFGSARGRLAAGVLYAALPVSYNAVSAGHFAGLVSYAAAPWLIAALARVGQKSPSEPSWRRLAGLALTTAVLGALAPAMVVVVAAIGVALSAGSLLAGSRSSYATNVASSGTGSGVPKAPTVPKAVMTALYSARAGVGAAVAAFALLLPWSARALWPALRAPDAAHPALSQLLRLQTGPYGGSDIGWALLVAAAMSFVIGRGWRLGEASRMWAVAFGFFALTRLWSPASGLEVLLAPAGAALVYCVALGAASVELDLSAYRFGWHQLVPAVGVAAALAAVLPLFSWVASGRWDLPASGARAAYAFPAPGQQPYRVLWAGAPGALPLASQGSVEPGGTSFATSLDGAPGASQLWTSPRSNLSVSVGRDLAWAEEGETTELGHLLALAGVRYVAVPALPGDAQLLGALSRQVDLSQVGIDPSYAVFANSAWLPVFFVLPPGATANQVSAAALTKSPWVAAQEAQPLRAEPLAIGRAAGGAVVYGAVPPGTWVLDHAGGTVPPSSGALGATLWRLPAERPSSRHRPPAQASATRLVPAGGTGQRLAALATVLLWAAAFLFAIRRRRRPQPEPGPGPAEAPAKAGEHELALLGERQ
jgi:GT2 family glycosyltransferase